MRGYIMYTVPPEALFHIKLPNVFLYIPGCQHSCVSNDWNDMCYLATARGLMTESLTGRQHIQHGHTAQQDNTVLSQTEHDGLRVHRAAQSGTQSQITHIPFWSPSNMIA